MLALLAFAPTTLDRSGDSWLRWRGACAWSSAIAVKVYPAYLVFAFWVAGWRRFATTLGVTTVALVVLPGALVADGIRGSVEGFLQVNQGVVDIGEPDAGASRAYVPGQSLRAVMHRYLTNSDATAHDDEHRSLHLIDLDRGTVENSYRVCVVLLALIGAWLARGRSAQWCLAWGILVALLITPYARKAHFVLCLFPLLIVLRSAGSHWKQILADWGGRLALLSWVVTQLSSPTFAGRTLSKLLTGGGVFAMQVVLLLVALWLVRNEHGRNTRVRVGE